MAIGPCTKFYNEIYEKEKSKLIDHLKQMMIEKTYETEREILRQFNDHITEQINAILYGYSQGEYKRKKYQEEVIIHFKGCRVSDTYEASFFLDGFIEKEMPKLRQKLHRQYDNLSKAQRNDHVYDLKFLNDSSPEEITKFLAQYLAPYDMLNEKYKIIKQLTDLLEKEKYLVKKNHFNSLSPVEVLDYMLQLTQINPENKKPFLPEKKVYDLTNMICQDNPVSDPISMNLLPKQKKFMIRFIYEFYKFCKDEVDSKGTRNKYLSILSCYISQFEDQQGPVNEKNFARERPDSPIKVDPKFGRWKNA